MSEFHIGDEVGLAEDHDKRGVIVDSHPTKGWLVWWCGEMAARWHKAGDLWFREDAAPEEWLRVPHRCPVCMGTGVVSRPPGIAYDVPAFVSTSAGPWPCQVCGGAGLVWGP